MHECNQVKSSLIILKKNGTSMFLQRIKMYLKLTNTKKNKY